MNRSELEHAIAAASAVSRQRHVLVIGSQSILGSYTKEQLPVRATMSAETDIAPLRDDEAETVATLIDAQLGEWSDFNDKNGFYVQGVSIRTAYLPAGWASRLVRVEPSGDTNAVGLCLEPHDLCAAKLARFDSADQEFVDALIDAKMVDATTIRDRILKISDPRFSPATKAAAVRWTTARI